MYRIYTLSGAVVIAVAGSLMFLGGPKKTPEQYEMLRRQRISAQGRMTDGTVIDMQEFASDSGHSTQMVHYTYDVAGVRYSAPRM